MFEKPPPSWLRLFSKIFGPENFAQQQLSVPFLGVATPAVLRAAPTFAFVTVFAV
jgi:hypothetical protein